MVSGLFVQTSRSKDFEYDSSVQQMHVGIDVSVVAVVGPTVALNRRLTGAFF